MCSYCNPPEILMANETCYAVSGNHQLSFGHTVVIAKRHVSSYFELTYQELEDMNQLAKNVKMYLDRRLQPDGYNVGVNIGVWAGQDTDHAVMHIIPRFAGDVPATKIKDGIIRLRRRK